MQTLTLTEFTTSRGIAIDPHEVTTLRRLAPSIRIEPSSASPNRFDLTPDQRIGVVQLPFRTLAIQPKVPMASVGFLISYALDRAVWSRLETAWQTDLSLTDLIAVTLCQSIERATRRGLLTGYRSHEESLSAPRGRIRFSEHISMRLAQAPPIEIEHDIYTTDIVENRLLLSALLRLRRLPLRSSGTKTEIGRATRLFGDVQPRHYPPHHIPRPQITQLNRHYESALNLADLVLRSCSANSGQGSYRADSFLIDMNAVFEDFVRVALREAIGCTRAAFPDSPPQLVLDAGKRIRLRPDLCFLTNGRLGWVGDAKYKRLSTVGFQHADVYQMLAYLIATGLSHGTLIYAAQSGTASVEHLVKNASKTIRIRALDLSGSPGSLLRQVGELAQQIKAPSAEDAKLGN